MKPHTQATSSAIMGARFNLYALASTAATVGIVGYAYSSRHQFYPAVIYLVTSKLSVSVRVEGAAG